MADIEEDTREVVDLTLDDPIEMDAVNTLANMAESEVIIDLPDEKKEEEKNEEEKNEEEKGEEKGEEKKEPVFASPMMSGHSRPPEGEWVAATRMHCIIMNDHVSEWLRLYGESVPEPSPMLEFLMTKGHTFEFNINEIIKSKYPVITISKDGRYDMTQLPQTEKAMREGAPIISSAPLSNPENKTYGVADLIIRSDILAEMFPGTKVSSKGCKFSKKWHYVIIDIKFSTLPLRADGVHILNQGHYKAYKCQLNVYTQALGHIQEYTPTRAYILGRKYRYTSKGQTYTGTTAFDKLGVIDYSSVDSDVPSQVREAISWIRLLREEGKDWNLECHPELYPNMKYESLYMPQKKKLAEQLNEITQIWYCGVNQREIALSKGIVSWKDPKFSAAAVEIKGQRGATLDRILEVNRTTQNILPTKLRRMNAFLKKGYAKEFYVDFETLGGMFDEFEALPTAHCQNMIFMITVGWVGDEGYQSKTLTADNLLPASEKKLMDQFLQLIGEDSELFHWSDAEPNEWRAALRRHGVSTEEKTTTLKDRWTDLLYIFREEPIAVKGALNYSLKNVARAMASLGMITGKWDTECQDGMTAMLRAYQAYKSEQGKDHPIIKDIERYNQVDVEVMHQIVVYLREHLL